MHVKWLQQTMPEHHNAAQRQQYKINSLERIMKTIKNCNIHIVEDKEGDYGNIEGVGANSFIFIFLAFELPADINK